MKHWPVVTVVFLFLTLVFSYQIVSPQEIPTPNSPPIPPAKVTDKSIVLAPKHRDDNPWMESEINPRTLRPIRDLPDQLNDTGGPDAFGYTFDDNVNFRWPDATQGIKTNISGDDEYGHVDLGFEFPFYEQSWDSVYVSTNGFLSFGQGTSGCCGRDPLPLRQYPNNLIAPFWSDLEIDPDTGGAIWVLSEGQSPNRVVVIEWRYANFYGDDTFVTFAVELHENGDIFMHYEDMSDESWRGSKGIEDSTGYVGLEYDYWIEDFSTIAFYSPSPSYGALAYPIRQGGFSSPGVTEEVSVKVRNFGRLGADTFDIEVGSNWPAEITKLSGGPLSDTNGNGIPDTGLLPQGEEIDLLITVTTPPGAAQGDWNDANLYATSVSNSQKSAISYFQTTVPAPHAQAVIDDQDYAMGLNLLQPDGQRKIFASEMYESGFDPALAEIPGKGFIYAWSNGRYTDPNYDTYEERLYIALTDHFGELARNVQLPFNPSNSYAGKNPTRASDWDASLAVAPNGQIGLTWIRYLYSWEIGEFNYNVYFATLNSDGDLTSGPFNLSQNTKWGEWGDPGYKWIGDARIAATIDGRFTISWTEETETDQGYHADVYFAVADNAGAIQKPRTRITSDPGDDVWIFDPTVSAAPNNRATIFYTYQDCLSNNCEPEILYAIIDENNNVITHDVVLTPDDSSVWDGGDIDAALLSDGRTMVVWSLSWDTRLRYAVLNPQQQIEVPAQFLYDSLETFRVFNPSVAAAEGGQAVVTWNNRYNQEISYALLDSAGTVLTDPQVAYRGQDERYPYVSSGFNGSGTTSYSWQPSENADAKATLPITLLGGKAGETGSIPVTVSNLGQNTAKDVQLVLNLGSGLTYSSDDSGITPDVDGSKVTWELPDLNLLEQISFNVSVQIPGNSALGTKFPVEAVVSIANEDANGSNDSDSAQMMVGSQTIIPMILRP